MVKRVDMGKYAESTNKATNLYGSKRKKELPADSKAYGLGEEPSLGKLLYGEKEEKQ